MAKLTEIELGLKVRSNETALIDEVKALYQDGQFQFIELYLLPGADRALASKWASTDIPFVLHAPHAGNGVNLAERQLAEANRQVYDEVSAWADVLNCAIIVAHSGNNGTVDEVICQLRQIDDPRICIENKPLRGLAGETCLGHSPKEVREIIAGNVGDGFVLDFGHAIYAAKSLQINGLELVEEFMQFEPVLFHLADGKQESETDMHLGFGQGDFPLKEIFSLIPQGGRITLEIPRPGGEISAFASEMASLKALLAQESPAAQDCTLGIPAGKQA